MTVSQRAIEDWSLHRLLTEVIGSGPKSADDMDSEQAAAAFHRILDGKPDPTTLGAFLLANRWKGNTPEELAAFLDVMRDRSVQTAVPNASPVDCGANYDGKTETALLGVAAGIVAAAAGTPVVVHSADRIPATRGVTYRHVLDALGVATKIAPETSARMVDETGFGFYYAPEFNPGLRALLDRRIAIGVRTVLNTLETLANPADAAVHLGSFFHLSFATRIIETITASESNVSRIVMVQGLEGYDDIRPGYTKVAERRDGSVEDFTIETANFGLDIERSDLAVAAVKQDSATITKEVLEGRRQDVFADAVALNAALRIYAHGKVDTLEEGLELSTKTLADGEPARRLEALQEFQPHGEI